MKKLLLTLSVLLTTLSASAENYILYKTSNGEVLEPNKTDVFGANIVSNTYEDGQGKIVFDGEVTMIGERAFEKNRSELTFIEIPSSVTEIGMLAFSGCSSLEEIHSLNTTPPTTGKNCFRSVRTTSCVLKVPNESIEDYKAAENWKKFNNIVGLIEEEEKPETPENNCIYYRVNNPEELVTPTNPDAFGANIVSNSFERDKDGWTVGKILFDGDVTQIGDSAFLGCNNLSWIKIPSSVTEIGNFAFHLCFILSSAEIPNSVTKIGENAFYNCGLSLLTLPDSLVSIGRRAFTNNSIYTVEIPESVTEIGGAAFTGGNNLRAFFGKFASEDNRFLIKDGVMLSFASSGLTSYEVPNYVTKLDGTFLGCKNLKTVVISESVTEIGDESFCNCFALTSIELPKSVTKIGNMAFANCLKLKEITSHVVTPPTISFDTFLETPKVDIVLKVPDEAVEAYKSAEFWNEFPNIVGIGATGISEVETEEANSPTHNLLGQPVGEDYKGIVIEGGRKSLKK